MAAIPRPSVAGSTKYTGWAQPLAGAAVAKLHPANFDLIDPGLDHSLRPHPVLNQALAPIGQLYALHRGQKRLGLRHDGPGKQPASAAPQDDRQRIVNRDGVTEWDKVHYSSRRITPSGGSGRLPPTSIRRLSQQSRQAV